MDLPFRIGLINLEQPLWTNLLAGVWWCLHAQHPVGDMYSMAWDSTMRSGTYWQFRGMRGMTVDTNFKGYLSEVFKCSWSLRPASCYGGKADEAAEASRSLEASLVARRVVLMDLGKQTSKESTGLTASCHNYTHLSWPQNVIWDKMNLQKIAWKFGLVKYDSLFQIFSGDDRNDNDPCVEARCLKIRGHRCIWQNIPGWISMNFVHQPKEWTSLIFNTEAFSLFKK